MRQVVLVTGAGTGFGRLASEILAEAGHTVYATMRDVGGRNSGHAKEIAEAAVRKAIDLRPLELDVGSQESCQHWR